jgi:hypothetical protein
MTRLGPWPADVRTKLTAAVPAALALKVTLLTKRLEPLFPGLGSPRLIFTRFPEADSSALILNAEAAESTLTNSNLALSNCTCAATATTFWLAVFNRTSRIS